MKARLSIPSISAPSREERGLFFDFHGYARFAVPSGWRLTQRPEGHVRVADPEDEMMIELSALRLPPEIGMVPCVADFLRTVVAESRPASISSTFATAQRDGMTIATCECALDARDTKRPEAPPRPSRSHWAIAANRWTQALVTGCCWETDAATFAVAWDRVVRTLELAGRLWEPPEPRSKA